MRAAGITVATGRFREMMHVSLVNDGPVTLWIDTAEDVALKCRDTIQTAKFGRWAVSKLRRTVGWRIAERPHVSAGRPGCTARR